MLSMINEHGMIEIDDRLMCIMFIVKKTNSQLAKSQRYHQHRCNGSVEESFIHRNKTTQTGLKFETVRKMTAALLLAELRVVVIF